MATGGRIDTGVFTPTLDQWTSEPTEADLVEAADFESTLGEEDATQMVDVYVNYGVSEHDRALEANQAAGRAGGVVVGVSQGKGSVDSEDAKGWQDFGNCLGVDPDLFFPERGASTREAKEVCKGCVVREDCLEYALAGGEKFGIWGGLSERERRRIRRQRALARRTALGAEDISSGTPTAEA